MPDVWPKPNRNPLTFQSPAPPGLISVQTLQLVDSPAHSNGRYREIHDSHIVSFFGQYRIMWARQNLDPEDAQEMKDGKRDWFMDDRMIAIFLLAAKLKRAAKSSEDTQHWTFKALALFRQFNKEGVVKRDCPILGLPAYVFVDGRPHSLIAQSRRALMGENFGLTRTLNASTDGPLFCVSESPMEEEWVKNCLPVDQLFLMNFDEYAAAFTGKWNDSYE